MNKLQERIRKQISDIRTKPVALKDFIPLMQEIADELDIIEKQQTWNPASNPPSHGNLVLIKLEYDNSVFTGRYVHKYGWYAYKGHLEADSGTWGNGATIEDDYMQSEVESWCEIPPITNNDKE